MDGETREEEEGGGTAVRIRGLRCENLTVGVLSLRDFDSVTSRIKVLRGVGCFVPTSLTFRGRDSGLDVSSCGGRDERLTIKLRDLCRLITFYHFSELRC